MPRRAPWGEVWHAGGTRFSFPRLFRGASAAGVLGLAACSRGLRCRGAPLVRGLESIVVDPTMVTRAALNEIVMRLAVPGRS